MVSIDNARVATCIAAAALAGASAAAFPSVAWADDSAGPAMSVPLPDAPAATATATDVDAVMGAAEANVLGAAITTALDAAVVVEDASPESSSPEPQDVTAANAPESAPSADPAATPASAPEQPVPQASDIKAIAADTTGDTAAAAGSPSPTSAASHPAVVALQSSPSNLNVSVRVDSPGDGGAVTQVNIAAGAALAGGGGGTASSSTLASAPAPASGSGSSVAGGGQPPAAISSSGSGATSDADTWSWQWDCLSVPAFTAISPNSSTAGSMPTNWTWIWNCGDNPVQYQGGTAIQYQPVNMNVSIRISSPGNDGPVSQSNVAVAVGSDRTSPDGHTPATPLPFPSPIGPGGSFPGISSLPAIPSLPGLSSLPAVLSPVVSASPSLVEGGDVSEFAIGTVLTFVDDPVELPFVLPGLEREGTALRRGVDLIRAGGITDLRTGVWAPGIIPRLAHDKAGAAVWPSSIGAVPTSPRSDVRSHAKPTPRWRRPVPTPPAPESAPLGASAAASTGGGSSGGGLPVFLALPFLVALLDLARRVALERVASPSEHRSRMPDTPG